MPMKILDFIPAEGYILVEPLDRTSGDYFQVYTEEFPQLARVLKIGPPTYNPYTDRVIYPACKAGDVILHSAGGFETLKFEGKEYRIVRFDKILAIKA